jgi:predicted N-formylglutamate amidohydrolase
MTAAETLLGPGDPPPYVVLNELGQAPALIVCDHASRAIPRRLGRLGLDEAPTWQHIAWDIGAGDLARGLSAALGAPAVLAGYSRLVVDCNRLPEAPDAFRTESDGHVIPGNQGLTELDRRLRLASLFEPYHAAITAQLDGFRSRGILPLVIAIHTFTPRMGGQDRPWHVGVLWHRDEPNARRLLEGLRAVQGLVVGDNQPYSGGTPSDFTIRHHAEQGSLPHVCLEVRQDEVGSPEGLERWIRLLGGLLGDMLADPAVRRPLTQETPEWRHANRR